VFLYGIATVALVLTGIGLSLLIGGTIDAFRGELVLAGQDTQLASALALTVVGGPAWLIFMLLAQRAVRQHPSEVRSQARRLYLNVARGIGMGVITVTAILCGTMIVGVSDFSGGPWGWLLTWSFAWAIHQRLAVEEPATSETASLLDRMYLYLYSAIGLYVLGVGAIATIAIPLSWVYDRLFREPILEGSWLDDLLTMLVVLVVGGAVWALHWLRSVSMQDVRTTMWFGYLFLFGVTVAVFATVIPVAVLVYSVLEWWFGDPSSFTAAEQFELLPVMFSIALIAGLSWGYHRSILREGAPLQAAWSEPERIYRYLVAAAGLLTLAAGIARLLTIAIDAVAQGTGALAHFTDWWRNPLVLGITLLAIGGPLWARYWFQAQAEAERLGAAERSSQPRRVFLFVIFGLAVLVVLVDLTIVLFQLFEGVLDGTLSAQILSDTRWSIALILVAGVFGAYYWLVLREDQQSLSLTSEAAGGVVTTATLPVRQRTVVVVTPAGGENLARRISAIEGVRVRNWQRLDTGSPISVNDEAFEAVRERILTADADHLLVILRDGSLDVVPYEER